MLTRDMRCPHCDGLRVVERNFGRKVGCAIGMVAGSLAGGSGMLAGGETGALLGVISGGPPGVIVGGMAGSIFGALVGGVAGCAAGAKAGESLDGRVLDRFECLSCEKTFNLDVDSA